ncbi:MAG: hypothetical protein ABI618_07155 [Nitrospirota bacterium]
MPPKPDHTLRNTIIGTVLGGLLLAFLLSWVVPSIGNFFLLFWGYIKAGFFFVWSLITSDYSTPGWIFLLLGMLSIPTIIRTVQKLKKPGSPQAVNHYFQDNLFGTTWRWEYGYKTFLNLWCFCSHCDMELVFNEVYPSGFKSSFNPPDYTEFFCEGCHTTRAKIEGSKDNALGKVEREIRRKIRTGEWQTVLKESL